MGPDSPSSAGEGLGRRSFVSTALLSAASRQRVLGANERVGVGLIGYGLIGKRQQKDASLVAVAEAHRGRRCWYGLIARPGTGS